MFKKLISGFMAIIMLFIMMTTGETLAAENLTLPNSSIALYIGSSKAYVNNIEKSIDPDNKSITPIIQNSRTIVPVKFISENFGCTVLWDNKTKKVTVKKDKTTVIMQINSKIMYKNGVKFTSDVAPFIKGNRTYLPLKVLSESINKNVFYDRSLVIVSEKGTTFNSQNDKPLIDTIIKKYTDGIKLTLEKISTFDKSTVIINCFDSSGTPISQGSGFYIGEGVIATNYHVVSSAKKIVVETEDNKKYDIEGIISSDIVTDLALLKTRTKPNMPVLKLGFNKTLVKGQQIVTISSPEGLKNTVANGIISGFRNEGGTEFIQISAPITYGSSGSPLFDMYGNVIGVNSSGMDTGNLNFAVSINHIYDWFTRISGQAFANIPTMGRENYTKDSSIPDTDIKNILNSMVKSFNSEDTEAYLNNCYYKDTASRNIDKDILEDLFYQYNIGMVLQDIRIIKKTTNETLVRAKASYSDRNTYSSFSDNTTSNLYYLRKYGTQWKIFRVDTEAIISLDQNGTGPGVFDPITVVNSNEVKEIDVKMAINSLKYSEINNKIYAINEINKKLLVINSENKKLEKTISLKNIPSDLCLSSDNKTLYIVNEDAKGITEINLGDYSITREIPWDAPSYPTENSHFHIEFYNNKLYLVDATWAPSLWILDLDTLKATNCGQNNNSSELAQNKIDNVGDLIIDDTTGDIFFWQQYGWHAGYAGSDIFRYEQKNGGFNKLENAGLEYPGFVRDPLDTPIMLVKDKNWVVAKNAILNMYNLKQAYHEFDENIYAVDPKGKYAISKKYVYELDKFGKLGRVPVPNADFYLFDASETLYMVDNLTSKILYCTIE